MVDRVDLKAEIISVADGADGVRWAITRNQDPDGPVMAGTFLKRIAPDGTVRSIRPAARDRDHRRRRGGAAACARPDDGPGRSTFALDGTRGDARRCVLGRRTSTCAVPGFVAEEMRSAGPRTWITGTLDGVPAVVLLDGATVLDTITCPARTDVSFAWVDDDTVLATSDGRLLRIDVRH